MRLIHIATASTVPAQRLTLNNREYLTAPVVMIVAGVLNSALVPDDELRPEDWNGVPIVVNHPIDANGQPISARQPDVLAAYGIGQVFRVRLSSAQRRRVTVASLQGELWLDIVQAETLGGEAQQALSMLEAQEALEVSTAFFSEEEQARGTLAGVTYTAIHHQIRPDHLAVLPNQTGACNWQDGCGSPRLNHQACACQEREAGSREQGAGRGSEETSSLPAPRSSLPASYRGDPMEPSRMTRLLALFRPARSPDGQDTLTIAQTDMDVREALYGALAREMGTDFTPIFIDGVNVSDRTFTYRQGERLRQRGWTVESGVITLSPDVTDVQRETTYTPVTKAQEEPPMTSPAVQAAITALLAQPGTTWTEADRPQLEAMSEMQLSRLAVPAAPSAAQVAEAGRRLQALGALQRNPVQIFTTAELEAMTTERLEGLVQFAGASADYSGRGVVQPRSQTADEEPEFMPSPQTMQLVVERQKQLGLR